MQRHILVSAHIGFTVIATLTIALFFTSTLLVELFGSIDQIITIKSLIFYALPLLLISMPALMISGKQLAGNSKSALISSKLMRMKFIAANGILLVGMATFLFFRASSGLLDNTFYVVQFFELLLGGVNLILMGMNIRDGLMLSGKIVIS